MKSGLYPSLFAVVVGLAMILSSLASADAHPFTPKYEAAYQAAIDYWGSEPANCISLSREIVPAGTPTPSSPPLTEYAGFATIPTKPTDCVLWVISKLPNECYLRLIMRHEVGHLLGLQHSEVPGDPMTPGSGFSACAEKSEGPGRPQVVWRSYWVEGFALHDAVRARAK